MNQFSADHRQNAAVLMGLGMSIIPVQTGGKRAAIKWLEFQHRRPTPEEVEAWSQAYTSWAVVTGSISGIVVVDCDSPESLDWARENLPYTPLEVLTSQKAEDFRGRHLYYRHPGTRVGNRARIRTSEGKLALDVRGDGGYVLSPGSAHPSGLRYEPMGAWTPEELGQLPIIPSKFLETPPSAPPQPRLRVVPNDDRFRRATAWIAKRDPAVEGFGGNDHTFRTACGLVRGFSLDDQDALALLLDWNLSCSPPWSEDELVTFIHNARAYGKEPFGHLLQVPLDYHRAEVVDLATGQHLEAGADTPWEPPLPLATFTPPRFPLECIGGPMAEYVHALAVSTQTPVDMAGMLVLAAVAATIQGKVSVEARPGWGEGTNLYTAISLPPANRKSSVVSPIVAALTEWEKQQAQLVRPHRLLAEEQKAALMRQIEIARKKGVSSEEIAALRIAHDDIEMPAEPRVVADDITPERAASLMAESGCRLAIFSAEGGLFDIIAGRYSQNGGANLDLFLKAHQGETFKVDRQRREREPIFMVNPRLTLGLAIQPEVLDGLFSRPGFRGKGLLARFVFIAPPSLVGSRDVRPDPIPPSLSRYFRETITSLLDWTHSLVEPVLLRYSHEADMALEQFEKRLEPRLKAVVGDLCEISDWAGKSAGLSMRLGGILGILGFLACTNESHPSSLSLSYVEREVAERSIQLVEDYLIPHAQHVFNRMGADPDTSAASYLLTWALERSSFTRREAQQGLKHSRFFQKSEQLDAPLRLLEAHGYLRRVAESGRLGPGRRAGPTYLVNPLSLTPPTPGQKSQNPQNRLGGQSCG